MLIGESHAPNWQLRHNNVLKETKDGLRPIVYVKGAKSIYEEEVAQYNPNYKKERITFKNGKFEANVSNKILIEYLENHPEFGVKFKLLDPRKDAKDRLQKEDLVFEAQSKLRGLDEAELEAVAIHIWGDTATANKDPETIKTDLIDYVKDVDGKSATGVSKPEYFLEILDNPNLSMKFIVTMALRHGVLKISSDRNSVAWAKDGGTIVTVPSGKKPIDVLADYLLSDEGEETAKAIGKAIAPKPKTRRQKATS